MPSALAQQVITARNAGEIWSANEALCEVLKDAITNGGGGNVTIDGPIGQKDSTASVSVTFSTNDESIFSAILAYTSVAVLQPASGGNLSVQTNSTGTAYSAFGSQACNQLTLINPTNTTILFRQGGSGVAIPLLPGDKFTVFGITNANQIDVKRQDESNTQVTVYARWEDAPSV